MSAVPKAWRTAAGHPAVERVRGGRPQVAGKARGRQPLALEKLYQRRRALGDGVLRVQRLAEPVLVGGGGGLHGDCYLPYLRVAVRSSATARRAFVRRIVAVIDGRRSGV